MGVILLKHGLRVGKKLADERGLGLHQPSDNNAEEAFADGRNELGPYPPPDSADYGMFV